MNSSTIWIGNDHGGAELKQLLIAHLQGRGLATHDVGSHSSDIVRYPIFAAKVAGAVSSGQAQRGIPRASDPSKYPLSCAVFDLTDGCGSHTRPCEM